jgi:hypothetical protein
MLFCASLAPWEKPSAAAVKNCAAQQAHHHPVQQEAEPEADQRRQHQCQQHFHHARYAPLRQFGETPHHMVRADRHHHGAGETADQRVGG